MQKYMKAMGLIMIGVILAACGNSAKPDTEKIAVIRWEKAVNAHPENSRLVQGEKVIKNLVKRRDAQAELGKSQMGSLQHLRTLKQISEQTYLDAELRTQLIEKEQIAKAKLMGQMRLIEKEAEQALAPMRKALEDEYRLRIFNLRLEKDRAKANVRPRDVKNLQNTLAALDEQIQLLVKERENRMLDLESEKQVYISKKMGPKIEALHKEMQEFAEAKKLANQQSVANSEGKYDKMMAAAPEAMANALAIMDREIDKQQDKNNTLKKKINSDIESIAVKLAKQRGYTIVFNTFKANVSAADITDDVIAELKKLKDK